MRVFRYFISLLLILSTIPSAHGEKLTSLAEKPEWDSLNPYQKQITKEEFTTLLHTIYTPHKQFSDFIRIKDTHVDILKEYQGHDYYRLHFANELQANRNDSNSHETFGPEEKNEPYHIVLDPGHIGGEFAEMEFRHFTINNSTPIREGEICLRIAKKLRDKLIKENVKVTLTREINEPVTPLRPNDLRNEAMQWFARSYGFSEKPEWEKLTDSQKTEIKRKQNILFYRTAEIRARSEIINQLKPDIVICLHINAAPWENSNIATKSQNHMHFLVNGTYMQKELEYDDIRFDMIWRIVNLYSPIEIEASTHIAFEFAKAYPAPPFIYRGNRASTVNYNPYIWSRNLLANRVFNSPVVYLEPFVANSSEFIDWHNNRSLNMASGIDFEAIYVEASFQGIMNYIKGKRKTPTHPIVTFP